MAKEKKSRDRRPVHHCFRPPVSSAGPWKTACGLKLDKAARKEVVLTDEWKYATCPACKEKKP